MCGLQAMGYVLDSEFKCTTDQREEYEGPLARARAEKEYEARNLREFSKRSGERDVEVNGYLHVGAARLLSLTTY